MDLGNTDVLVLLADLHVQATQERSHYYTGKVIMRAIAEITELRTALAAESQKPAHNNAIPKLTCMLCGKEAFAHLCRDHSEEIISG